ISKRSVVIIFEPYYVVFAKIWTALDLDKNQQVLASVKYSMSGPHRNEHIFVCPFDDFLISHCNQRFAFYDDPVLAAVLVHLQAEPMSRLHFDTLYLISSALGQHFVHAPGSLISFYCHSTN